MPRRLALEAGSARKAIAIGRRGCGRLRPTMIFDIRIFQR